MYLTSFLALLSTLFITLVVIEFTKDKSNECLVYIDGSKAYVKNCPIDDNLVNLVKSLKPHAHVLGLGR
uniref:Movement protein TGBp3 n=1 Tax=Mentha arvensis robigovirus 1 TaxID=3077297 RepID=A0AA96HCT3_9VIRU|nr:TGBp3 [Mentha arvensis robigovirus 1]